MFLRLRVRDFVVSRPVHATVNEDRIRALLERYNCPVPYHQVRTRFLGCIASPDVSASPLSTAQGLWNGQWPALESAEAINELVGALINDLWNSLTCHLSRREPFRLIPMPIAATASSLRAYALVRQQEIDGFIEGLFNGSDDLVLPKSASRAVDILAEASMTLAGIQALVGEPSMRGRQDDLIATAREFQPMPSVLEHEIHSIVMACTQVRRMIIRLDDSQGSKLH